MNQIRLRAFAKINLGLDVLGRRENGYHDVRMIMQSVGLFDQLHMKKTHNSGITLSTNLPYLPSNENNLVYRAVSMLMEEFHIEGGIEIRLEKYIPVAAGMAGGSTDCAAALFGMNQLYRLGLGMDKLFEYGAKLGADVPFCLMRGTAVSEGIGEILTPLPFMPHCYILIAKPGINVSTKYVYDNLDLNRIEDRPDIDGMIDALNKQDLYEIAARMSNVLESVTVDKYPVIDVIKQEMKSLGALNSIMSGSGPTVFGIYDDLKTAKTALNKLRKKDLAKQVFLVEPFHTKQTSNPKK